MQTWTKEVIAYEKDRHKFISSSTQAHILFMQHVLRHLSGLQRNYKSRQDINPYQDDVEEMFPRTSVKLNVKIEVSMSGNI